MAVSFAGMRSNRSVRYGVILLFAIASIFVGPSFVTFVQSKFDQNKKADFLRKVMEIYSESSKVKITQEFFSFGSSVTRSIMKDSQLGVDLDVERYTIISDEPFLESSNPSSLNLSYRRDINNNIILVSDIDFFINGSCISLSSLQDVFASGTYKSAALDRGSINEPVQSSPYFIVPLGVSKSSRIRFDMRNSSLLFSGCVASISNR